MKKALYTCITGDYDRIMEPLYKTPGWDYICFTDNKYLESDFWDIRLLNTEYESTKKARHVKIMSVEFLEDYDITIWADGNIRANCNLDEFVDIYLDDHSDLGISMHPERNCIYEEINKCIQLKKDDNRVLEEYRGYLQDKQYPPFNTLVQTGVIVRRHRKNNKDLLKFSTKWWNQVLKYSKRDQLSFNYIMHIFPINYNVFSADILKDSFRLYKHGNTEGPSKLKKNYGENFYYFNTLSYEKTLLKRKPYDETELKDMSDINKFLYTKGLEGFDNFKKQVKKK